MSFNLCEKLGSSEIYIFLSSPNVSTILFSFFKISKAYCTASLLINNSLENEILPYLAKKKKLKAIKIDANFIDIGIPYDYSKFCEMIKNETN